MQNFTEASVEQNKRESMSSMIAAFENGRYNEVIECAWNILYTIIIPSESSDVQQITCNFIVILRQLLQIKDVKKQSEHLLSILDLIVHPRKHTVIDEKPLLLNPDIISNTDGENEMENKRKSEESITENTEDAKKQEVKRRICVNIVE